MNQRHSTLLNMVRACLNVAESPEYKSVWISGPPADFRAELEQVAADFDALTAKGALSNAATGGGGDAKAAAETALEDSTYVLARALALHFRRTGDLDRRGKVDLTRSDIVRLRAQELVNQATAIRDIAATVVAEPGAEARGISAKHVEEHSIAIAAFANASGVPRGQIANRSALLREIRTDVVALVKKLHDLDDLILQFDRTATGRRFIEAWRSARVIVDVGGGLGATAAPTSTPEAQTPAATRAAPAPSTPVVQV